MVARVGERWSFCRTPYHHQGSVMLFVYISPVRTREIATCRQRWTAEVAVCKNDLYAVSL